MNATPTTRNRPLSGLRVLDFSIMLAGPYCARLMADGGADVVKIEPPEGDDMRLRTPLREGHSAYFGQLNAGKRSLTLDLKNAAAIATIRRLVENTDVIIENFRPGVMDRLGLGYAEMSAINPRLVYCSISGYGQTGPQAERAAYAMIVHAESGFDRALMHYAGDRRRPAPGAIFVADVLGGINAYAAIQTALVQRAGTGAGQRIDVALMDCMLNLLVYELQEAQFPVATPRPAYGPVRALDGDLLIAPITPKNFEALCDVTGQRELLKDPRFATAPARAANWNVMMGEIETWTRERSVDDCLSAFDRAGVPSARYNDAGAALTNAHLRERGSFVEIRDGAGAFLGVNAPWNFSDAETSMQTVVPEAGGNSEEVLAGLLGMSSDEIRTFRESGALGAKR